jgi:hypothetical protein
MPLKGHPYGTTLEIGLNEAGLEEIVKEMRAAPSLRELDVQLKEGFFGKHPRVHHVGGFDKDCLLSWWSEQPQSNNKDDIDMIEVTWTFDIAEVIVCPEIRSSLVRGERDDSATQVHASISKPVGVYYQPPSETESIKDYFSKLLSAVNSLRPALYLIGIGAILIAIKLLP